MSRYVTFKEKRDTAISCILGLFMAAGVIHGGFKLTGAESPFTTIGNFVKENVITPAADKAAKGTIFEKDNKGKRDPGKRAAENFINSFPRPGR